MSTITKPRATKKFKALVAVLGSEDKAIAAWNKHNPDSPIGEVEVDPQIAQLVAAGFSVEEAQEALAEVDAEPKAEAAPLTSHEIADAAVAQAGLTHFRGRVYSGANLIEAQVRVLKTGKPEIVKHSGETKTKGVVVYRTDDGTNVVLQNLGVPS